MDNNQGFYEHATHHSFWTLDKFETEEDFKNGNAYSKVNIDGNILLNSGINLMWTLIAGGAGTTFSNANSYLGVGDSSTAENATQTSLQAATNKLYKAMDSSFPSFGTLQKIVFQSTFAAGDANFAWNEFTVSNTSGGTVSLNRKVSSQGTKTAGQVWVLSLTITLS